MPTMRQAQSPGIGPRSNWRFILLLGSLVVLAYAPAVNNGFISDDYVILGRLLDLKRNLLGLFSMPPEGFRLTSYCSFALLKAAFGYRAEYFYAFTVLLHLTNAVMVWRLLGHLTKSEHTAKLGALFFAVCQNPQEAMTWLAGMNEALLAAFILGMLLAWIKGHQLWSVFLYVLALFSKESAVALLLLVPLVDYPRAGRWALKTAYLSLVVPLLPFCLLYLSTRNSNTLLTTGFYAIRVGALWVLVNSLHRLVFPWAYFALIQVFVKRAWASLKSWSHPVAWMAVSLLPYIFLTYQNHVPSRNQYVASVGLAWLLALAVEELLTIKWRYAFVAVFLVVNIAYLWFVKDPQYVLRAAPTNQLIMELQKLQPQRIRVTEFPLNPWMAKNTTLLIRGWQPEMVLVNEQAAACAHCPELRWNPRFLRYTRSP